MFRAIQNKEMKTTTDFEEYTKENGITKEDINFGFDVDYEKRLKEVQQRK